MTATFSNHHHGTRPGNGLDTDMTAMNEPGYEKLADVLARAYDQAARGKGKERHAQELPFHEQPMQSVIHLHGVGFATGQASKKASEALRLPTTERRVAELLGAIVYLCGAVIALEAAAEQAASDVEPCMLGCAYEWIDWPGGECPVLAGTLIDVRYRDGHEEAGIPALTPPNRDSLHRWATNWAHVGSDGDIIAYRIINPAN